MDFRIEVIGYIWSGKLSREYIQRIDRQSRIRINAEYYQTVWIQNTYKCIYGNDTNKYEIHTECML